MRKVNKRLVGGMWVAVPWERNPGDIEIVTASPNRGSSTSFQIFPIFQVPRSYLSCRKTAEFSFTIDAASPPKASL